MFKWLRESEPPAPAIDTHQDPAPAIDTHQDPAPAIATHQERTFKNPAAPKPFEI